MDLRPWDLWTHDGQPQPGTDEVIQVLEAVLAKEPDHPLALHLYIHSQEVSPHPGEADAAADRLRNLQPGLAHLVHMPSHVDVRRGRWKEAELRTRKRSRPTKPTARSGRTKASTASTCSTTATCSRSSR